jgi:hypothetical protein
MPEPKNPFDAAYPPPAPIEFAGQWIAWNRERNQIVAHGRDMASVHAAAVAQGHPNAILQRVRRPERSFIGPT